MKTKRTDRPNYLHLHLCGQYFDEIRREVKPEEFRLCTDYWAKRLLNRHYDGIQIMWAYPSKDEHDKILVRPWRGVTQKIITHPHFGPDPVSVFAIPVYK